MKDKLVIIPNFINDNLIKKMANEKIEKNIFSNDTINFLSIGRFTHAKNFEMIPLLCRKILDSGINVRWYLIGFGILQSKIEAEIEKYNVSDNVIIIGKQINPYPYIKACDIYAQLSRYEGKAVAVIEAQILGKPVVISNYKTATSQLINGFDGHIVSMEFEKMLQELLEFIKNDTYQQKLVSNCLKSDYTGKSYNKILNSLIKNIV